MKELFNPQLKKYWNEKKFSEATPIQKQVYPFFKNKESVVAISPTGTGKTLAYLLPTLERLEPNHRLQAIIFAPTQELAQQIFLVADEWSQLVGITCMSIVGGANVKRQIEKLKNKPELIVATPGRFNELLKQTSKLKVHTVEWLVYDEADYLFSKGEQQITDINLIEKRLMKDIQRYFFSATKSEDFLNYLTEKSYEIEKLEVSMASANLKTDHIVMEVNNRQKTETLKRLAQIESMQAIVFFDQISDLERAAAKLIFERLPVSVLHSQLSNQERQIALEQFRQQKSVYLLTTDLASRGLDIEDVPYVIHYNAADNVRIYFHRSGRTGRMNKEGCVISIVNQQEGFNLRNMLKDSKILLEERVLYNRQLLSEKPAEEDKKHEIKKKPKKRPQAQKSKLTIKTKKKKRKRNTKNIGKPRKKD
ncbi:DEAD/DEAH box helicase [Facklamia miroungae]|uniref:Superfamily II DNA and RNA helicase n=1 Tax=Facklamia miroungae TaxID=120956 RepID=A0A1G7THR1_9LACT|nr:DEAD/DEAH box helicase [Facklamia miroungae]NKZ29833.1 DEAD/DEAH box helicase [Facklamia miroungae]SDG34741.1 Superfamily II DNA and RNA helicase [Facklamia miroungae]